MNKLISKLVAQNNEKFEEKCFDCSMPNPNRIVKLSQIIDIAEYDKEIEKNINL